jgi:hypothetical protein
MARAQQGADRRDEPPERGRENVPSDGEPLSLVKIKD